MKACMLLLVLLTSCCRESFDQARVESIGQSLISLENINKTETLLPDIVYLGEGLSGKIMELKAKTTKLSTKIEKGDFQKPFGDNQADCTLTILTDIENIGIRLKYNKAKDKYDILGWMTLAVEQN